MTPIVWLYLKAWFDLSFILVKSQVIYIDLELETVVDMGGVKT